MKVSTLKEEARRVYKFPIITQNLGPLSVIKDNGCTIKLDRTSINVMKGGRQVMEGYTEQHTILWRMRLEDASKDGGKFHLCIRNKINDHNINVVLPGINIQEILE